MRFNENIISIIYRNKVNYLSDLYLCVCCNKL